MKRFERGMYFNLHLLSCFINVFMCFTFYFWAISPSFVNFIHSAGIIYITLSDFNMLLVKRMLLFPSSKKILLKSSLIKAMRAGHRQIAQRLRGFDTLAEHPSLVSNAYKTDHRHDLQNPLLVSASVWVNMYIPIYRYPHIHT